eukprot:6193036-Pleurochrysis_carterae.AAC.1
MIAPLILCGHSRYFRVHIFASLVVKPSHIHSINLNTTTHALAMQNSSLEHTNGRVSTALNVQML